MRYFPYCGEILFTCYSPFCLPFHTGTLYLKIVRQQGELSAN
jgi:hypothetical protein